MQQIKYYLLLEVFNANTKDGLQNVLTIYAKGSDAISLRNEYLTKYDSLLLNVHDILHVYVCDSEFQLLFKDIRFINGFGNIENISCDIPYKTNVKHYFADYAE